MFDFLDVTPVELTNDSPDTSKWQRCFFDLEGSLTSLAGDILQVAAITTDWDFNITSVFNMYFKNHKPIGEKEFSIHGISQEYIDEHAEKHFTEMLDVTPLYPSKPTMFISYTTFDVRRINEELTAYGIAPINFGEEKHDLATNLSGGINCHLDAYRYGRKRGSMVSKELGDEVFADIYKELEQFGSFTSKGSHDALYDSVMLLAICRRFVNGGIDNADTEC